MKKQRLNLEYELNSNSANIIWSLISSAHGLEKWIADSVKREDDVFTFRWGEEWGHHEIRSARIVCENKLESIRMRWENEEDEDAYWQIGMEKSDITNDYMQRMPTSCVHNLAFVLLSCSAPFHEANRRKTAILMFW